MLKKLLYATAITAALVCCLKAGAKVMIPSDGYYVTVHQSQYPLLS